MDCTAMILTTSDNSHRKITITSTEGQHSLPTIQPRQASSIREKSQTDVMSVYHVGPPKSSSFTVSSCTNSSSPPGTMEPRKNFEPIGANGKTLLANNLSICQTLSSSCEQGPGFSPEILWTRIGWFWYQHCKVRPVLTYNSGGKYDNWETSSSTEIYQRSVLAKIIFTTLSENVRHQQSVASFENVSKSPRDQPTWPFLQTGNIMCLSYRWTMPVAAS